MSKSECAGWHFRMYCFEEGTLHLRMGGLVVSLFVWGGPAGAGGRGGGGGGAPYFRAAFRRR